MKFLRMLAPALILAGALSAQQFKIDLDRLAAKASNSVDVSLNSFMLQLAAKFLDPKNNDEAKVKKMLNGLEGIFVRTFEFKNPGEWSESDLEPIRKQLKGPDWSRIVGVKSSEEGEKVEIYLRSTNSKVTGVAILASEPKSLTVVNIAGAVDLASLADLGDHFGFPKVDVPKQK